MYHDRTFLGAVLVGIFKLEALREVIIHLYGSELPFSSESILYHEVEFRAIECSLTILDDSLESLLGSSLDDSLLGFVPVFIRSDVFLLVIRVAERNLSREVLEIESTEYI